MLTAGIDKMSFIHDSNILFELYILCGEKMGDSNTAEIVYEKM